MHMPSIPSSVISTCDAASSLRAVCNSAILPFELRAMSAVFMSLNHCFLQARPSFFLARSSKRNSGVKPFWERKFKALRALFKKHSFQTFQNNSKPVKGDGKNCFATLCEMILLPCLCTVNQPIPKTLLQQETGMNRHIPAPNLRSFAVSK